MDILFLGVLKGSFVFLADLVREVRVPCAVDFVRLSSYGSGTRSSQAVRLAMPWQESVSGRHVIVVEEIVDSGLTLARLLEDLRAGGPASVAVCALVDKVGRREVSVPVRYRGFLLEDGFLVGYGLDFGEKYRNLSAIYELLNPP
jgi:hypoxanthine phosphoribosyltransferase